MRSIELLAPARDLACGLEAIRHGADAVYIGAPRFGARAAAGNSLEDLAQLVEYAHLFGARIYVTLNTLLRTEELSIVQELVNELADIHVDALITQDSRIRPLEGAGRDSLTNHLGGTLPLAIQSGGTPPLASLSGGTQPSEVVLSPIPLHASTQMDNRSSDDVRARQSAGYRQTVLARELSLEEIRRIHEAVPEMPLEVFVHGALCVSYSGRCYASEYCFGRSANRGECAQFCRLPFDLVDASGRVVQHQRHLLSLRDMNRSAHLEELMDAGVSSFKIEGRLKDASYVKNITAFYRQQIDAIIARRPQDFARSSFGGSHLTFTPQPEKSFNRGFTTYFLHGRTADLSCHATPKSLGEPVGTVKEVSRDSLSVAGSKTFANGDGLCFIGPEGRLEGFRVNRVDQQGRLFPASRTILSTLRKGMMLYRNYDAAFEALLARPTAERKLAVQWRFEDCPLGFQLSLRAESGQHISRAFEYPHESARSPQSLAISRQLVRLGDTPFACEPSDIELHLSADYFIPASVLADWRRQMVSDLLSALSSAVTPSLDSISSGAAPCSDALDVDSCEPRVPGGHERPPLMICRYCIRYALGQCLKEHPTLQGPLALQLSDGRRFPLHFDCRQCQMQVLPPAGQVFSPEF